MPKIIKSKLGRSYFSVTIDSIHAPSPFWWEAYLVPKNEIAGGQKTTDWIPVDKGYVEANYSNWHKKLKWQSSGPLNLKWQADNPYMLVIKLRMKLAGIENLFVKPIQFQSKKKAVQTYRMILMQHVFASAASESRFLEARVRDILQDILQLHPQKIENAYITGHACEIGKDDYNKKLSLLRAQHTYDVLTRQLNILISLGQNAEEAKRIKSAFKNHVIGFGFWVPYQFEPKLLMPGMKEPANIVRELNQYPLQRVRNRRTEIQLTITY
ncbi:MAG: hypothetical protein GXO76_16010 [Calditrichaeota bacterium]|nr:hypothetical protein [Calditrichota bacterium]